MRFTQIPKKLSKLAPNGAIKACITLYKMLSLVTSVNK